MVIQTANIIAGFMLAAPKLKEFGARGHVERVQSFLAPYVGMIGVVELVLGILALVCRMGIVDVPIPMFGASYPQALPAIAVGMIMSAYLFEKYPAIRDFIARLKVYEIGIGMFAILAGLVSIFFGCPPMLCGSFY